MGSEMCIRDMLSLISVSEKSSTGSVVGEVVGSVSTGVIVGSSIVGEIVMSGSAEPPVGIFSSTTITGVSTLSLSDASASGSASAGTEFGGVVTISIVSSVALSSDTESSPTGWVAGGIGSVSSLLIVSGTIGSVSDGGSLSTGSGRTTVSG